MVPTDRGDEMSGWKNFHVMNSPRCGVNRMRQVLDVFGAGKGLMLFVAREAPLLLVSEQDPFHFVEFATDATVHESLLKDVLPAQVSAFDVDGNGSDELVVGRKGYARALSLEQGVQMVDQFNARRGEDVVSCIVPVVRSGRLPT